MAKTLDAIACTAERVPTGGTVWLPAFGWRGVVRYKNFCRIRVAWTTRTGFESVREEDIAPGTPVLWTTGTTAYVVVDGRLFKVKVGGDIQKIVQRKRAEGHVAFQF